MKKLEKLGKLDYRKWLKRDNLLILVLSGVLLFIVALPTGRSGGTPDREEDGERSGGYAPEARQEEKAPDASEAYVAQLEGRLGSLLAEVDGAGRVEVMITLGSSEELVVEKDVPVSRSGTDERDSAGGSRTISQMQSGETTVYRSEGGVSEPYVVKTLPPRISGVVVVAEGAGTGQVSKNLSDLVQALFGLEAHRVKVVKMSSQNQADQ